MLNICLVNAIDDIHQFMYDCPVLHVVLELGVQLAW